MDTLEETYEDQYEVIENEEIPVDDPFGTCCLCPEGIELRNLLVDHLQSCQEHYAEPGDESNNVFEVLQCCSCLEGRNVQKSLLNHLLSHFNPTRLDPEHSASILENEAEIRSYQVEFEPDQSFEHENSRRKPSYQCKFNRRARSPKTESLLMEFTFDPNEKVFKCKFCQNGYKHKQTVERHLTKAHSSNALSLKSSNLFYCNICKKEYKHKQTVERHLAKEHNILVAKNRVNRFSNSRTSRDQPEIPKNEHQKNLVCDSCGQKFIFRENLRKHLLRHTQTSTLNASKPPREKIVCDQCSKLVHPNLMKRHFRVHHSSYRPFKCDEPGCKTSFFEMSKFNDHKNIHLKIKPYVCEFCQESFHYASSWRQHRVRHTDPDKYKCKICSNCFVSTKSLKIHMRLHSAVESDDLKSFACDYEGCEKTFRYLDRLKLHTSNVHRMEGEKKCDLCSFVTFKNKYFKRHLLKAHNIREGNPRLRVFPVSHMSN